MFTARTKLKLQRSLFRLLTRTRYLHPILRLTWPAMQLRVGGHTMLLHPADNVTERFMWLRGTRREAASIGRLTVLVAGKRSLIFDIGANCGAFTLPLAEVAKVGSHIVAFEPNPTMAARMRRNLALNGLANRVELQEVSLGARDGQAKLWLGKHNLGASSLLASDSTLAKSVHVPVRRLVNFLPSSRPRYDVFVIKCDVEGLEDQVLCPFLEEVPDATLPDAILAETQSEHLWGLDLSGLLKLRGYVPYFDGEDGNTLFLKKTHP